MQKIKKIYMLLLSIFLLIGIKPVAVYADGITDAIQKIVNVYPNQCSYFTSDGKSDSNSSDSRCMLGNIPARGGLPSGAEVQASYGTCWSCHAFAEYVWYIMYGHGTNTQSQKISASELKRGDFVIFSGSTINSGHSAIYLSEDSKNYYVYDSNWASPADNKVRYNHSIAKTRGIKECYRATNYDEIANSAPAPTNPYYNSYGFDNPSNNEVITEGSFLFQGWIDAKKAILSITCSINHGSHYVETGLYTRTDVPNATAFRAEVDSNLLNIGNNDIALCVNFTDGSATVVENRTVTWSPKLLWGYDSPTENMEISDDTFQFSGWVETGRRVKDITCSLNNGERYITANLYTRPDVPNAIAFRADIWRPYLHYGDNFVSVCVNYANGTGETLEVRTVKNCIADAIEYPADNETFTCKDSKFLLQGWSLNCKKTIDHFEYTLNGIKYTTAAHIRSDLAENARYYRVEIPVNKLKNGKNEIEVYVYYTDGNSRSIAQRNITGDVDHKWDEGKITQEATCSKPGIRTYVCTVCNATKTEEIPATGENDNIPELSVSQKEEKLVAILSNTDKVTGYGFVCGKDSEVTLDTPGRIRVVFTELNEESSFTYDMSGLTEYTYRAYVIYTDENGDEKIKYSEPVV